MSQAVRITNQRGANGADYIADTNGHTGRWQAITAVEAAVAALVAGDVGGTLTAVPIPAGTTIYGAFTSITLASGKVWADRQA